MSGANTNAAVCFTSRAAAATADYQRRQSTGYSPRSQAHNGDEEEYMLQHRTARHPSQTMVGKQWQVATPAAKRFLDAELRTFRRLASTGSTCRKKIYNIECI
jgi:hypothetical protein